MSVEDKKPVEQEPKGPNDNWKDDPRLDENGNPKEDVKPNPDKDTKDKTDPNDKPKGDEGGDPLSKDDDAEKIDFSAPVVKQVEEIVKQAGLDSAEVARAVTSNDGEVTPAIMKALVEKHGEAVANIVANQLKQFHTSNKAEANKRDQAIFNVVADEFKGVTDQSGEDSWKELSGWAKENVPNDERKEINKLLQQGGLAAQYAVRDLVARFKSSDNFTVDAQLLDGDNTSKEYGVTPLSKADYQREFRALEAKGHVYGQSRELAELDKRRTLGMKRGI